MIPGGSGGVGRILRRALAAEGHETVVLSRKPAGEEIGWDGRTLGAWADEIDGADAVINLAGRSVNCRYTPENRKRIMDSRVRSVTVVGEAIAVAKRPPPVWLQASTATIYAHRYNAPNDESTGRIEADGPDAWRFSLDVALAWEKALEDAPTPRTRKVALRSAITMSPDRGGAFDVLLGLVRKGIGGHQGDGRQYVSWIHDEDFASAVGFLLGNGMEGPVNLAAPNPLPNRDFMRDLRAAWGVPFGLSASGPILAVGAWAMGTETELVLKSRRVVPGRLLDEGFRFQFPNWPAASRDLVERWKGSRA